MLMILLGYDKYFIVVNNITMLMILLGYDNSLPTANIYQIPETINKK